MRKWGSSGSGFPSSAKLRAPGGEAEPALLGPRGRLCPQSLTLRGAERQKLLRADLHRRHTLLHRALLTWRVGAPPPQNGHSPRAGAWTGVTAQARSSALAQPCGQRGGHSAAWVQPAFPSEWPGPGVRVWLGEHWGRPSEAGLRLRPLRPLGERAVGMGNLRGRQGVGRAMDQAASSPGLLQAYQSRVRSVLQEVAARGSQHRRQLLR